MDALKRLVTFCHAYPKRLKAFLSVFVRLFPFKILETLIKTIKNVSKTV